MTLLECTRLTRHHHGVSRPAIQDIDFTVRAGDRWAIMGESGSGKSTLARCLAGWELPDSGQVQWTGQRPHSVQLVMQGAAAAFNPRWTAHRIAAEPLRIHHQADARERSVEILEQVGLPSSHLAHRPAELSGGQRQRLALARALAAQPRVLLLDEAFTHLDENVRKECVVLLHQVCLDRNVACVLLTHHLDLALSFATQLAILHAGRLVEKDSLSSILRSPRHQATQALLDAALVA